VGIITGKLIQAFLGIGDGSPGCGLELNDLLPAN